MGDRCRQDLRQSLPSKHFNGLQGRVDGETTTSSTIRSRAAPISASHAAGPCREDGDVIALDARKERCSSSGVTGPEARLFAPARRSRARPPTAPYMIADMTGAPLYVVAHELPRVRMRRSPAPARPENASTGKEPLIQEHLLLDDSEYANRRSGLCAARRVMSPPFRDSNRIRTAWVGPGCKSGSLQVVATGPICRVPRPRAEAVWPSGLLARSPTAPAGSRTACRCCGHRASIPGG